MEETFTSVAKRLSAGAGVGFHSIGRSGLALGIGAVVDDLQLGVGDDPRIGELFHSEFQSLVISVIGGLYSFQFAVVQSIQEGTLVSVQIEHTVSVELRSVQEVDELQLGVAVFGSQFSVLGEVVAQVEFLLIVDIDVVLANLIELDGDVAQIILKANLRGK